MFSTCSMLSAVLLLASSAASLAYAAPQLPRPSVQSVAQIVDQLTQPELTAETADQWAENLSQSPLGVANLRPNSQKLLKEVVSSVRMHKQLLESCFHLMDNPYDRDQNLAQGKAWQTAVPFNQGDETYRLIVAKWDGQNDGWESTNYRQYNIALMAKVNVADKLFQILRAEGAPAEDQQAMLRYAMDHARMIHQSTPAEHSNSYADQIKARDTIIEAIDRKLKELNR